jgi:hypothetical protein
MALRNKFSWSKSRHKVFRECPRKYFYKYYASWGGWYENASPRTREIYVLKNLAKMPAWVGSRVHKALGTTLGNLRRGVAVLSKNKVIDLTLQKMRAEFVSSRRGDYLRNPKRRGLFEHAYGAGGSEEDWRACAKRVATCLNHFYASDLFAKIKELRRDRFLAVDDLGAFQYRRTPIYVKTDFACRKINAHVFDWKTGKGYEEEAVLPAGAYAMYLHKKWDVPRDKVVLHEYNLFVDEERSQKVTPEDVRAFQGVVRGSLADMASLLADRERNEPKAEEAFDAVDDDRHCTLCNFQRVCPARS